MALHTLHVLHGKDHHQMSSEELRMQLKQLRLKKMELAGRHLANTPAKPIEHSAEIRQNRKAIARIITVLISRGERCV